MSNITFTYLGKEGVVTDLDSIGAKYGLYRITDESLEAFKKRVLSIFIYEHNQTESGISFFLSRALGATPENVGYIKIADKYRLENDGVHIKVYEVNNIAETQTEIYSIFSSESNMETFKSDFEDLDANNFIYIKDDKFLSKQLCFFTNFSNSSPMIKVSVSSGVSKLMRFGGFKINPNSLSSDSDFLRIKVATPNLVTEKGKYYFDESDSTLITYSDTGIDNFMVTYCGSYKYIPFSYSPIRAVSLGRIIEFEDSSFIYDQASQYIAGLPADQIDLLWDAYVNNNLLWKANQTSPLALSGTYYGK